MTGTHQDEVGLGPSKPRRLEAYRRGLFCLGVFVVTFMLVSVQDRFATDSLRWFVFGLLHSRWPGFGLPLGGPHVVNGSMMAPVLLVSVSVTLPVVVYQLLVLVTGRSYSRGHLILRTVAVSAAFSLGLAVAYHLVLPVVVEARLRFTPISIAVLWVSRSYLYETVVVLLGMGLAFAAPLLRVFLAEARRHRSVAPPHDPTPKTHVPRNLTPGTRHLECTRLCGIHRRSLRRGAFRTCR